MGEAYGIVPMSVRVSPNGEVSAKGRTRRERIESSNECRWLAEEISAQQRISFFKTKKAAKKTTYKVVFSYV